MDILLSVATLFCVCSIHEVGHMLAMRKRGIPIKEIGVGIPLFKALCLQFRNKRFGNTVFTLSPFLLGMYVGLSRRANRKIKRLELKDQIAIYIGGCKANFLLSTVLLIPLFALMDNPMQGVIRLGLALLLVFIVLQILAFVAKHFSRLVIRLLFFALIAYLAFSDSRSGGAIAIVQDGVSSMHGLQEYLLFVFFLSLSLGLFNLLPFAFLDGGKISEAKMLNRMKKKNAEKKFESRLEKTVILALDVLFMLMLVFLTARDIFRLF